MKETKTVHISFAFYDRANLEKFLEEQAAEGWLIVTYAPNSIKFRRIRPEKLHFSIIYYHTPVTISGILRTDRLVFGGRRAANADPGQSGGASHFH